MKILMTAPRLNSGGVNAFVRSITTHFENIDIFCRGRNSKRPSLIQGIMGGILMPFRFVLKIVTYRPDRIIVNTSLGKATLVRDGLLVAISKLMRCKVLLIIHGFNPSALKYKILLNLGYYKADAIIVLAESFKKKILLSGYKSYVYTQYNPVNDACVNYFLQLPKRDFTRLNNILYLSRIEKSKGVYIVIDAFRLIAERHKDAVLNIVGDGTELEDVIKYTKEKNVERVCFHGYKENDQKHTVLANNDVMLFPSYGEGLPICVLEAMVAGQIVITRPLGGLVDLYKDCPFGSMIDSLAPQDFADAYEQYAKDRDLTKDIRIRNQYFASNFYPSKIVSNIQRILEKM